MARWFRRQDWPGLAAIFVPSLVIVLPWTLRFWPIWPMSRVKVCPPGTPWAEFIVSILGTRICPTSESCISAEQVAFVAVAFVISLLVAAVLALTKLRGRSLDRVRHALAVLAISGAAVASASMCVWDWLNGGQEPNSVTVRNVALGFAALLTVVFVIWRERIASGQASFERFQRGTNMLNDGNMAVRIGGICIIREVGRYWRYREQAVCVLEAFISHPTLDVTIVIDQYVREDVQLAARAIEAIRSSG